MSPSSPHYTPAEVLPIEGEIILLDAISGWGDDWLEARIEHQLPCLFSEADGSVPNWVGLEYMAQAIGALAGIRNLRAGNGKRIGFLLGTRKYHCHHERFSPGETVTVRVEELFCDADNLGVFNCTIRSHKVLADASIKMLQPGDANAILEGTRAL